MRLMAIASMLVLASCAGARPYQRGHLAQPCMQFDADPMATLLEQHVFEYREGSSGGYGGGGGGCGCN